MTRVVLVTGVSRGLAARVARSLISPGDLTVVGVDVTPRRHGLGTASFERPDLRSPEVAEVVNGQGVDTVVRLAVVSAPSRPRRDRPGARDHPADSPHAARAAVRRPRLRWWR